MLVAKLTELARVLGVETQAEFDQVTVKGISIDSRAVKPGHLFVAIVGERVDGHDYLESAAEAGASAVLVSKMQEHCPLPQICVDNIYQALAEISKWWIAQVKPKVIAITGSNGKTTVKNIVLSILSQQNKVHATAGNHNNELGLPLTVLSMPFDSAYLVVEMGASHPGDIAYLCGIAKPDVGVITSLSGAHLEHFGSLEAVAQTKAEILKALPDQAVGLVADCPQFQSVFSQAAGLSTLLVLNSACQQCAGWQGDKISLNGRLYENDFSLLGEHNRLNATLAATVCLQLGVAESEIQKGLSLVSAEKGRLDAINCTGFQIIDDSYNANPASMKAGIDVLSEQKNETWLVLGDMAELGEGAEQAHVEIGQYARKMGINRIYAVGVLSQLAVVAFAGAGQHFKTQQQLITQLLQDIHAGVSALVKGSRSAAMDKVVAALVHQDQLTQGGCR